MISIIQKTLNRHHLTCRSWFDQWIPIFRLEDEIRKKREEEDEKLMEKYAQIEANYQKRLRQAIRRMD